MPAAEVRRWLPRAIVGLSIESAEQLREAEEDSAVDYYGVSPVFATPTKTDTAPALGLDGCALRALTRRPLVAIGGIHAGNAALVMDAGADGPGGGRRALHRRRSGRGRAPAARVDDRVPGEGDL